METTQKKAHIRPIIGIAVLSLIACGLFFPLLITAIGQTLFPYQANGEQVKLDGKVVGSYLVAQDFNSSVFFLPRNASASGVDPDITLQDAMSQVPRISNATGIPSSSIVALVNKNIDPAGKAVELQYVNVLSLNIQLIEDYPTAYSAFT